MPSKNRKSKIVQISLAIAIFVAAIVAAIMVFSGDKPAANQAPSSLPVTVTVAHSFYDKMYLHLTTDWKVQTKSASITANNPAQCTAPGVCANFTVFDLNAVDSSQWQDAIHGSLRCTATSSPIPRSAIVRKGGQTVGAKTAEYYEVACSTNAAQKIRIWKLPSNLLVVTNTSHGRDDNNIDKILLQATF